MTITANPDWQAFTAFGWNAFPLPPRSKTPATGWKAWQHKRSNPEDHRRWQGSGCNAAIVTGSISGVVVLDCDTPEAVAEAERLGTNDAPRVNTAKGAHFYFRHPGGKLGNKIRFLPGMDLRGDGGFVVGPGSIHPSGALYHWATPAKGPPPACPKWLLDALKPKPREPLPSAPPAAHSSNYGRAALQSEIEAMRTAPEGTRNDQLNKSAFALAQLAAAGEITEPEAKAHLRQAAREAGLEDAEIETTLASGWKAGQENPRIGLAQPVANGEGPRTISAAELDSQTFAPLCWVLPGILPEGMTLLAGKPKQGKSFLAMQMALAAALGDGSSFGLPDMPPGDVLYLANEDSFRRIQDRMRRLHMGPMPASLHFAIDWPRIDQGAIDWLAQWCDAHPDARLIIIDTLRTIKAPARGRQSAYDEDAASVAPLHQFAKSRPGLAILVIHHTRKQEAADEFDLISGTHGLSGVFDTLAVIAKDAMGNATLHAQGRDVEHYAKALERDQQTGGWRILGEPAPRAKTGERQALLDVLTETAEPLKLSDLAKAVGKQPDTTRRLLEGLITEGLVCQPKHGNYQLSPSSIHSIPSRCDGQPDFPEDQF